MSRSASAYLVAGVNIRSVLDWTIKTLERDRFHPDTGEKSTLRYDQVIYTICGREIPIKRKTVLQSAAGCISSRDRFHNSYNIREELLDWMMENGFTSAFLHNSWHTVTNHHAPEGVLGVSVWGVDEHDPTDYSWASQDFPRVIDPKETDNALRIAKERLLAIGCEADPRIFVLAKSS